MLGRIDPFSVGSNIETGYDRRSYGRSLERFRMGVVEFLLANPRGPLVLNRVPKAPSPAASPGPPRRAGGVGRGGLGWGRGTRGGFWAVLLAVFALIGGCAYFNTFYHAKQFYASAESARETEIKQAQGLSGGNQTAGTTNTIGGINPADPRYANRPNAAAGRSADLYSKCIDKCKKVIDDYPGSKWQDDARLLMAKAYYGKGDYISARSELDHFAERFPKSNKLAEAAYWRGLTAFAQEDYPGAQAIWADLLQRYPKYDDRESVEFYVAEALREEELPDRAEAAYQEFLSRYTKGELAVQARLALGRLLLEDKSYDRATELFTHVATKAPKEEARLEAKLDLGEVLESQDEHEQALKLYQDVELWLDPSVFSGRLSAEEREAIRNEQLKAREQARQDSLLNAQLNPNAKPGGVNPATGQYDPNYVPPNGQTGGVNPATGQYDPNYVPPNGQTGGVNPATGQYDPNYNPIGQTGGVNPATGQYDPNYNPIGQTGGVNPATGQYDPNYRAPNPTGSVNPQTGLTVGYAVAGQANKQQRQTLPKNDPRYEQLGRVLLKEGQVLAALGRPWDAIQAYEQVIDEYRGTTYAAEAQYRIGYTYEVNLEDFDEAQKAYQAVGSQGRSSFTEDAERRAKNLGTVKSLLAEASSDSASAATAAAAQAHFMRAELYLFQQDKPDKALAEYLEIQKDFPGTDHEAKAALAEAWVRMHALADTARGRAKYAEVMRRFPDTEYGRRASRILKGPEREPAPEEFDGPSLAELATPENIASVTVRDSLLAAAEAPPPADSSSAPGTSAPDTSAASSVGERQRQLLERLRQETQADSNRAQPVLPSGPGGGRAVAILSRDGTKAEPPVLPPGGTPPPTGGNPPPDANPLSGGNPPPGADSPRGENPPPGGNPPPGANPFSGGNPPPGASSPKTGPGPSGGVPQPGSPLPAGAAPPVEPAPRDTRSPHAAAAARGRAPEAASHRPERSASGPDGRPGGGRVVPGSRFRGFVEECGVGGWGGRRRRLDEERDAGERGGHAGSRLCGLVGGRGASPTRDRSRGFVEAGDVDGRRGRPRGLPGAHNAGGLPGHPGDRERGQPENRPGEDRPGQLEDGWGGDCG